MRLLMIIFAMGFRLLTEINQSNKEGNHYEKGIFPQRVSVSLRRLINRTCQHRGQRHLDLGVSVSLRRLINRTPSPKSQQSQRLAAVFAWENQNLHHPHLQTHQKSRPALYFQGAGQNASCFSLFDTLPQSPADLISISHSPICTVLPPNQVHFRICVDTPNLTS